jgi:hypothetical protein
MARGNGIIVTASDSPKGVMLEGYIGAGLTPKPGQIMVRDPSVALKGGRHTYKYPAPGADGGAPAGAYAVLMMDKYQGKTVNDAYAAGDRCFLYCPIPGEELNLLLADVAGTGDDHTAGERLIVQNNTGKLVAFTGTPYSAPAVLLETITDPTADTLAWCEWCGQ